jgi:ABC-type phosphate/phosphonate transport system substrate-binding protein
MARKIKIITRSVAAAFLTASILSFVGAGAFAQTKPLQIGMAKSFVTEQPKSVVDIAADEFKAVLKTITGLDGQLVTKFDAAEVAEKLNAKQVDFGILHAHEFAWVQQKFPQLQPLLIAADKHHMEHAYLIVAKNCPVKTLADLRGKKLDMPAGTKEHCRLFLRKYCREDKGIGAFFGSIQKSASPKEALDNVARAKVDATVIDAASLEFQKEIRGPFVEQYLRVLQESDGFPPAVVVYKPGVPEQATVDQFRDGLRKAHTISDGRALMKMWNIDAFELVPKGYQKSLADVLQAYPAPAPRK